MNVDDLRAQLPLLRWMGDQAHPPKDNDRTILGGETKLGTFWRNCKCERRCGKPPYDRLLTNPVLRADYRITAAPREGDSKAESCKTRDQDSGSTEPTARSGMDGREEACAEAS